MLFSLSSPCFGDKCLPLPSSSDNLPQHDAQSANEQPYTCSKRVDIPDTTEEKKSPPNTSMTNTLESWIEDKLQNSDLLKPSALTRKKKAKRSDLLSLREAIAEAQKVYKGTVLTADQVAQDDSITYRIKILSETGIVKWINVDGRKSSLKPEE